MKGIVTIILFFGLVGFAQSQYHPTIRSARPGATLGAFTVGAKCLQTQTGFEFDRQEYNSKFRNDFIIETVNRIGLNETFELAMSAGYKVQTHSEYNRRDGLSALGLELDTIYTQEAGWKPAIGYQINIEAPVRSGNFQFEYFIPQVSVCCFSKSIGKKVFLGMNLGSNRTRFATTTTEHDLTLLESHQNDDGSADLVFVEHGSYSFMATGQVGYRMSEKAAAFLEIVNNDFLTFNSFGVIGLRYLVNNDFQLDIAAAGKLFSANSDPRSGCFFKIGLSWRTKFSFFKK